VIVGTIWVVPAEMPLPVMLAWLADVDWEPLFEPELDAVVGEAEGDWSCPPVVVERLGNAALLLSAA